MGGNGRAGPASVLPSDSPVPTPRLITERMELRPLPALAAAALPGDRQEAARILGATLPPEWPQPDLLDVLPLQAAASPEAECFGVWVMVERDSGSVVGDIGFIGPPDEAGSIEVGYSVIPDRRRRGYATEAAGAIVEWARLPAGRSGHRCGLRQRQCALHSHPGTARLPPDWRSERADQMALWQPARRGLIRATTRSRWLVFASVGVRLPPLGRVWSSPSAPSSCT